MSSHGARQFTAMQHFAFVFAEISTWILYLDDDWYFPSQGENNRSLLDILRDAGRHNVWQVKVVSYWYGACTTLETAYRLNLSVADCFPGDNSSAVLCPVLDLRKFPPHSIFSGRHSNIEEFISVPTLRNGTPHMTSASFVRTRQHPLIAHIAHHWKCSASGLCNTRIVDGYRFRHLKLYDFQNHKAKAILGNWGSITGSQEAWLAMNRDLCKVEPAPTFWRA
jgi:hypothetical protein